MDTELFKTCPRCSFTSGLHEPRRQPQHSVCLKISPGPKDRFRGSPGELQINQTGQCISHCKELAGTGGRV